MPLPAINQLHAAAAYELGQPPALAGTLYLVYLRGQAELFLDQELRPLPSLRNFSTILVLLEILD